MINKRSLIIAIAAVVVVLLGVSIYVLSTRNQVPAQTTDEPGIEIELIPTIIPSDLGLTLKMGDDGKRVIMTIKNTTDISFIDYELSYTSEGGIPRGAIGHVDVKEVGKAVTQEIVLGTCSDVCHYDSEVSDIKLIVKISKTDNKTYQSEISLK